MILRDMYMFSVRCNSYSQEHYPLTNFVRCLAYLWVYVNQLVSRRILHDCSSVTITHTLRNLPANLHPYRNSRDNENYVAVSYVCFESQAFSSFCLVDETNVCYLSIVNLLLLTERASKSVVRWDISSVSGRQSGN